MTVFYDVIEVTLSMKILGSDLFYKHNDTDCYFVFQSVTVAEGLNIPMQVTLLMRVLGSRLYSTIFCVSECDCC